MDPKCAKVHFFTFGVEMQKEYYFPLLEPKVRKRYRFRVLIPTSLNSDAETICFISICGQVAKRAPKCIFGPKNAFWGPKCILGPKNAFWAPKCSPAKRGQGVYSLSRTAVVKYDMSKCEFCENSEKVANHKKDFQ